MKIQLAGCVITDDYGRMLLLHRNTARASQWELPGGKVEPDEAPEAAAVRELAEELGVHVQLTRVLGTGAFEQDETEYEYAWFMAAIASGKPALLEPNTFDDFDYFDTEDLFSLALSPNMAVLLDQIVSGAVTLEV